MSLWTKRLLASVMVALTIGLLGWLAGQYTDLQWIVDNENELREWIQRRPIETWVIGFGLYTFLSLIPGTGGKAVVCGWLFGFWPSVLMVDLGLTLAAVFGFYVSRWLIRDAIQGRFHRFLELVENGLRRDEIFYLLMLRFAYLPFSLVNYSLGTTRIKLTRFIWTTSLGILPSTMLFVYLGTRIPSLRVLAENGLWSLLDTRLFAVILATIVIPPIFRYGGKLLLFDGRANNQEP